MGAELQQSEAMPSQLSGEQIVRARRAVASRAVDAADARDLLEMLGLVEPLVAQQPGTGPHGSVRRYIEGCRCAPCMDANTAYKRDYEARRRAGEFS